MELTQIATVSETTTQYGVSEDHCPIGGGSHANPTNSETPRAIPTAPSWRQTNKVNEVKSRTTTAHRKRRPGPNLRRETLSAPWRVVYDAIPNQAGRSALLPFIKVCVDYGCQPDDVTQVMVDLFYSRRRKLQLKNAMTPVNRAVAVWAKLVFHGVALPPLTPIPTAKIAYRAAWKALPRQLRVGVAQFLRSFGNTKLGTRLAYRAKLRRAIRLLVDAGRTPRDVEELLAPDAIDFIAAHGEFGPVDKISHQRRHVLHTLGDLARHHKLAAERTGIRKRTKNVMQRTKKKAMQISLDLLNRLAPFDDMTEFDRLLRHLKSAVDAFCDGAPRKTAHPRAQDALVVLIILAGCDQRGFIVDLEFTGAASADSRAERPKLAHPKNLEFEDKLPATIRALLERYYAAASISVGRPPVHLCESLSGRPRDASTVGKGVKNLIAEIGHSLSSYELRVLALKIMFIIKPSTNMPAVAGLFGYKTTKPFEFRFRPLFAANAAVRHAKALGL